MAVGVEVDAEGGAGVVCEVDEGAGEVDFRLLGVGVV